MAADSSGPFDVAIAGAGPAGSALALGLARAGLNVALLDAGRFPRDKLCGEFLSPEGASALGRLGLADLLASCGAHPIRRARLTTPGGGVIEAPLTGRDGRPALGLSRSRLDAALVGAARAAGASVFEQARVAGPLLADGRVAGLIGRHADGGPFAIRAAVTVAADGRHSTLVRQTGITRTRQGFRPGLFGLKRHLPGGTDEDPGCVALHLVPGGYVGTCGIEGGAGNLCGLLPEAMARRHRGDLDQLAEAEFVRNPELARLWSRATPAGPWKAVAGVRVAASRPRRAGIFYVGDGQGTVDPLGGQGMSMALLGAEMLGPLIVRAVRAGGADRALQREALRAWHRRFDRRVRLCRLLHRLLLCPDLIAAGSRLRPLAQRLLTASYTWTRDRDDRTAIGARAGYGHWP